MGSFVQALAASREGTATSRVRTGSPAKSPNWELELLPLHFTRMMANAAGLTDAKKWQEVGVRAAVSNSFSPITVIQLLKDQPSLLVKGRENGNQRTH